LIIDVESRSISAIASSDLCHIIPIEEVLDLRREERSIGSVIISSHPEIARMLEFFVQLARVNRNFTTEAIGVVHQDRRVARDYVVRLL
jgi:hypothetical protein